jgi:hypothetical protein
MEIEKPEDKLRSNYSLVSSHVMPYTLRFYLFLFVAGVAAFVAAVWLSPLGFTVNIAFALVAGYLGIIVGRWALGRTNL